MRTNYAARTPPMYPSAYQQPVVSPYSTYGQPVRAVQPTAARQPLYTPFSLHGGYFHPGQQYSPPVPGGQGYMGSPARNYDAYDDELDMAYRRRERSSFRRPPEGSLYADDGYGYGDPGRTWDRDWDPSMVRDPRPTPTGGSNDDGPKKIRSIEYIFYFSLILFFSEDLYDPSNRKEENKKGFNDINNREYVNVRSRRVRGDRDYYDDNRYYDDRRYSGGRGDRYYDDRGGETVVRVRLKLFNLSENYENNC